MRRSARAVHRLQPGEDLTHDHRSSQDHGQSASALTLGVLKNRWLLGGLIVGNLLRVAVVVLPPMGRLFHTVPFNLEVVLALGAVGSVVLWVEELRKLVVRRRQRQLVRATAS